MGLFDRFLKKEEVKTEEVKEIIKEELHLDLEDGVIYDLVNNGILDTTNPEVIEKFKHNLAEILKEVKEKGKVEKFKLIRDDDDFPYGDEWIVSSKNTSLEKKSLQLSLEIKKAIALKNAGLNRSSNGIQIPVSREKEMEALKSVPVETGMFEMPKYFRSTKHFTVNTPLEATGDYNQVKSNRNFTIIDDMDNFLNSGYAYSVAYHDAYLDISHVPLKISDNAVVLINEEKYEKLKNDSKLMESLKDKKVIIYKGEEYLAIDMVLTTMGVLPSKVGFAYAEYDDETFEILESSIKEVALSNGLKYDRSHGGNIRSSNPATRGHFSNYFDERNVDNSIIVIEITNFLKNKFSEYSESITIASINSELGADKLIREIGEDKLLEAINEYNKIQEEELDKKIENYKTDRAMITDSINDKFKSTIRMIDYYFENNVEEQLPINLSAILEAEMQNFFQAESVSKQLASSNAIEKILKNVNDYTIEEEYSPEMISMKH